MTTTPDLERIAIHEAGHSFAAYRAGRRLGPVTIRPGRRWAGTSHYSAPALTTREYDRLDLDAPYLLWPPVVRRKLDTIALVAAAGYEAEHTLYQPTTTRRIGDAPAEAAAELVATSPVTPAEERRLALARADTAGLTDDERLAGLTHLVYPGDPATGAAWLAHITAQARALVVAGAPAVLRLADALLEHHELSGRAARAILAAP